jgi:tetratricopeptide (TPR) repeat protein
MPGSARSRVFFSYSHDSDLLDAKVLALAERLTSSGFDCAFDKYEPHPSEGWPQWMDNQLDKAAFILVVCTEGYYRKSKAGKLPASGRGVKFESVLLIQDLYDAGMWNDRLIPVLFEDLSADLILRPLRGYTRYRLDLPRGYEELLRHLTGQPHHPKPPLGPKPVLPPDPLPLPSPELPLVRNIPDSLGDLFKGRDDLLLQLANALGATGAAREFLLCGLGGIGKTRLAIEYAWRYGARYSALLLVRADSPEGLRGQLHSLAGPDLLFLPERQAPEADAIAAVGRWLREHPGWLLILDGADTEEAARAVLNLLPRLLGGHILIASRFTRWPRTVRELSVPLLTAAEAVAFLLDHTASKRELTPDDAAQAAILADTLGHLPLALEQAAAYIAANQMSLAAYLDSWAHERQDVLEWYDELVIQYPASIAVTWQKSFHRLNPVAGALLRLTAHLAPEPIPLSMLADERLVHEAADLLCEETAQAPSHQTLNMALADLASYSLIARRSRELSVHRMVQEVLRGRIPVARRQAWVERSLRLADNFLPVDPEALHTWSGWDALRPHAVTVLEHADREGILDSTSRLRNRLGIMLQIKGLFTEAELQFRRAIEIAVTTRGRRDRSVAVESSNLASVLKAMGRLDEAEQLYRAALAIDEECLGAGHSEVAADLSNLAFLLKHMGHEAEAARLKARAAHILQASPETELPDIQRTRRNLAIDIGTSQTVAMSFVATCRPAAAGKDTELSADFSIKIECQPKGRYVVLVLDSPAGIGQSELQLLPPGGDPEPLLAEIAQSLSRATRDADRADSARKVGALLFQALFNGPVRDLYLRSLGWVSVSPKRNLRLSLHFDVSDPVLALLSSLPWELLYWHDRHEFLGRGRMTPIVRTLDVPRPLRSFAVELPLRVLIVSALPGGLPLLAIEHESRLIRAALNGHPGIEVVYLPHVTLESLRRALLQAPVHVLHFIGHGRFSPDSGVGEILLEDASGGLNTVPGEVFAELLRDFEPLRLVVLSTCGGGPVNRREGVNPFASVATALVMAGVPAVISMQFVVADLDAIAFSSAFYERLVAGAPVEAAANEGRLAIFVRDPTSITWAAPVVFLRSPSGRLFSLPAPPAGVPAVPEEILRYIIDFSEFIAEKSAGFVGRSWLFAAVDRFLETNPCGYFLLRGVPGVGLTAFMAEMSRRRRCIHHFNIRAQAITRTDQFLGSVCAQLIAQYRLEYPTLPPEARQDSRFLEHILTIVSRQLPAGQRAVILVSGLDQAEPDPLGGAGTNALHLPITLPRGIYFVVSARTFAPALHIDTQYQILEVGPASSDNMADVAAFVAAKMGSPSIDAFITAQHLDRQSFIAMITARSEGNFLYLRHLLAEIESGAFERQTLNFLPQGLYHFYEDLWRRMRDRDELRWISDHLPVMAILTNLAEPASVKRISAFSGIGEGRVLAVLRDWESLITVSQVELLGRHEQRYQLYHSSFREFIATRSYDASEPDLAAASQRLAGALWKELESGE